MTFDWNEFLKLAKFLHTGEGDFSHESALRSAVSRAYYAAFCEARRYAVAEMNYPANHDSKDHEYIREHYKRNKMSGIASRLDTLRQQRNKCDYEDIVYRIENMCEESLITARNILNLLEKREP